MSRCHRHNDGKVAPAPSHRSTTFTSKRTRKAKKRKGRRQVAKLRVLVRGGGRGSAVPRSREAVQLFIGGAFGFGNGVQGPLTKRHGCYGRGRWANRRLRVETEGVRREKITVDVPAVLSIPAQRRNGDVGD